MRRAGARLALGAWVVLALLAGCRTAPPSTTIIGPGADAPWPEQHAALEKLGKYALSGRVAVAANGQGFSGDLRYRQDERRPNPSLDGRMGLGGGRVDRGGDAVNIATSRGDKLDGNEARDELERRLGFVLPIAELRWWLLGIPAPGGEDVPVENAGTGGSVEAFTQAGWKVIVNS